jgi:hypothetical protein
VSISAQLYFDFVVMVVKAAAAALPGHSLIVRITVGLSGMPDNEALTAYNFEAEQQPGEANVVAVASAR